MENINTQTKEFNIDPVIDRCSEEIDLKIDTKTKPIGALGRLEEVARKIGMIQDTTSPELNKPSIIVFAGDHGIAEDGVVNPFPQEVTWQMVFNFLTGGAAINVFARQNEIDVHVVDAGVKHDFEGHPDLIDCKIAWGTKNYLHEAAMTNEQCQDAIEKGAAIVRGIHDSGSNVIGFGEMGIGNTSAASLIMSAVTGHSIEECVGSGTGLDTTGIEKKKAVLREVIEKHKVSEDPYEILRTFGGFEIAMMTGAMLQAAELGMIVMIDGFIVSSALLIASKINPNIRSYCIYGHTSEEKGHKMLLDYLEAKPLLNMGMRLGEGTGVAVAYPIVKSAVSFLNEMASFESAEVSNKD